MTNRSKAKGTSFETLIADYLRDNWDDRVGRRPLSGAADKGDIANFRVAGNRLVVECKNEAKVNLAGWLTEAQQEAVNDEALVGMVVAKRRGKGTPEDQYVILSLGDLLKLLANCTGPTT
jgi:hypothetical protein